MSSIPRLCISSTCGSGGKTMLSLGLGRVLHSRGMLVKPFKKGPDYIDAAWLGLACGTKATNLDLYFMDHDKLRAFFEKSVQNAQFAIIEGNRGLYDGLDETGSCSTAALARVIEAPLLLCIDCTKATRTIAAIIKGMMDFEAGLDFCGVVLNRTGSPRHETALRRSIEACCGLPVLGAMPRKNLNILPERHMGLASKGCLLSDNAQHILAELAAYVSEHCNVDDILNLANSFASTKIKARTHNWQNDIVSAIGNTTPEHVQSIKSKKDKPVIGYVFDKALWFYYPENLECLEQASVNLVKLSLFDQSHENSSNWEKIDGLYLGGGFPEDFAEEISQSPYLQRIKRYCDSSMPVYAECGGLMLLCSALEREGQNWKMGGIFPPTAKWLPKPQGLGYVSARVMQLNPYFPIGMELHGHEFHYSYCEWQNEPANFLLGLMRGTGLYKNKGRWDGMIYKNTWAAYLHIFAPAVDCWAINFAHAAEKFKKSH